MDSSPGELEVGPTEDTVLALLDFLVDPLLPSKSSSREILSPSQEELVAKQVHAVVLLYNYYHRKQHPGLEFLEFLSFCKLAVVLKPSLLSYLTLMQRAEYAELDDLDEHLSLTEKAIMNACEVSKSLDASINNPVIEGWPITKVAVFLVDSKKENCYLFHSSITQGVWSIIEKEANIPGQGSEAVTEPRPGNKKKRVIKRIPKENQTANQQLACLAVKEACEINQGDLRILENHMVYSTSKAKTAIRLYIMQCAQINQHVNLVPINDVIDSMQGPVVRRESASWIVTPVVEYFHLLPFADKVLDWLSREKQPIAAQYFEAAKEDIYCTSSHFKVEQLPNSSCHSKAVKELENCNSSHLKVEPLLNTSEPFEAAKEIRNGNSFHSKEVSLPHGSQDSEAEKEVRNDSNRHLEEGPLPCTSQHSHAAMEVIIDDNGCRVKEKFCPYASQQLEATKKVEEDNGFHLKVETVPYSSQCSVAGKEVQNNSGSVPKEEPAETVVYKKRNRAQKRSSSSKNPGSKTSNALTEYSRQDEEDCAVTSSSVNKDVDESFWTCSPVDVKSRILPCEDHVDDQKQMILAHETDQTALNGGAIIVAGILDTSSREHNVENILSDNKVSDAAMSDQDEKQDGALITFDSNFEHLRKIQLTIASKENLISQTALKVLFRKREQLSQHLRNIADEIAVCDRNIQTILNAGDEDDLAVKIDSIIECCNDIYLRCTGAAEDKTPLHFQGQDLPIVKRKRLSEANFYVQSPCQELDGICNENCWILPTYSLSASEDGFQASITVRGVDFECSSEGATCSTPHEARSSAASKMLFKLRSMAAES